MLSYIKSQNWLLVVFTSTIEIINIVNKQFIKSLSLSGLCSSLLYLPKKELILAGVIDKEVRIFKMDGRGDFIVDKVL